MALTGSQVIVLAAPVFLVLMALEWWVGWRRGRNTYRLNDALSSIGLGLMSQLVAVFSGVFTLGLYSLVHAHGRLVDLSPDQPWVWVLALVVYDFCYYWHHRASHRVALFWAAHVVHHQSEDYNLSTALRQTSTGWVAGWLFYLPMAVLGFPPLVFAVVALIDLLYQYWVHTQQIGRLGWFDRWFCAPSNHRVHHAVNDRYLDRNYGGILLVWDRLFGSHQPEDDAEPCVYGSRSPLHSWNPLRANAQVYAQLWRDSRQTRRWSDKLQVWWRPPGWHPADLAAGQPRAVFDPRHAERFDPPWSRRAMVRAWALFLLLLGSSSAFLWHAHALAPAWRGVAAAGLVAGLWALGRVTQPRSVRPDQQASPQVGQLFEQ